MSQKRNDWYAKAGQIWDILVPAAALGEKRTYKQVGDMIGLHHRTVRYALDPIQQYCLNNDLPILSAIVVRADSHKPGRGSVASGREDFSQMIEAVFDYPWESRANPFSGFLPGQNLDNATKEILNNPGRAGEVYRRIKDRGMLQMIFRRALMQAYNSRCAMCGASFHEVLEAAHIIGWMNADDDQKINPRNGILLCANHHRLFDRFLITVSDDYIMNYKYSDDEYTEYSRADIHLSSDVHGQKLTLPDDKRIWPNLEWLRTR